MILKHEKQSSDHLSGLPDKMKKEPIPVKNLNLFDFEGEDISDNNLGQKSQGDIDVEVLSDQGENLFSEILGNIEES